MNLGPPRLARWLVTLVVPARDRQFVVSLRMVRRNPVLSLVIVATLGLGIGLASTVFNITNAFVHQPLPFDESIVNASFVRNYFPDGGLA